MTGDFRPEDLKEYKKAVAELGAKHSQTKVKSRGWAFTINNFTQLDIVFVIDSSYHETLVYMIVGFEEGKSDTPHMQGFVYFKNEVRRAFVSDLIPRAHLEPSLIKTGCEMVWSNYVYCSKDGNYLEFGEYPQQGRASWRKIEAAYQDPKRNMALFTQYRKSYREVKSREVPEKTRKVILLTDDKQLLKEPVRSRVYYSRDLDTYDDEPIVYMPCTKLANFLLEDVKKWALGFPPKLRRGYELYRFDPDKVVLMVSLDEYKFFQWYFKGMVDNIKSYHTIECQEQEELELIGLEEESSTNARSDKSSE